MSTPVNVKLYESPGKAGDYPGNLNLPRNPRNSECPLFSGIVVASSTKFSISIYALRASALVDVPRGSLVRDFACNGSLSGDLGAG